MQLARILGTVTATQKYETLAGMSFKVIQPVDQNRRPCGEPIVAVDPLQTRFGDIVMWVGKREASLAIPGAQIANMYPVDAAVTGLVDWIGDQKIEGAI